MRFLFIDSSVKNYQNLVKTAKSDIKVVILDSTKDGVAQITEVLAQKQGVEAIEIVSHGSEGTIQLGKGILSNDSLSEYSSQLQQWSEALSEEADDLGYGLKGEYFNNRHLLESLSHTQVDSAINFDWGASSLPL